MSKTIIVSNRLPVKISKNDEEYNLSPSAGGLATGLGSIYKQGNNLWIGWPGLTIEEGSEQEDVTAHLEAENMAPVFLTESDIEQFYEGFSNSTLWPLFHYFPKTCV